MPDSDAQRPPPGETYLRELEEQLLAEFSERNARIERLRRLRHMETPVDIPPAYRSSAREVRTPLAREQLKRVIGSLTANRPLVHVPPAEPTEAARAGADLRARWTNAALRRMDSEAARDVFGMLIDAMVADGAGVLKLLYAPDRWAGYPRRSANDADESAETSCSAPSASRNPPASRSPGGTWTSPPSIRWKARTGWKPALRSPSARATSCSAATGSSRTSAADAWFRPAAIP